MCGIAGFLSATPREHDLDLMLALLTHRGPNELGTYVDERAAIGHARLSIVDLEDGHQPMTDENGDVVLAFNGEIFNYIELRQTLEAHGHRFRTRSDTEVLLRCYLQYGLSFVDHLNGQFAIALWDRRERKLVLVRDRLGIRPLFFHRGKDAFIFASEMKSILTHVGVTKTINAAAIDQIFTFWTPVGAHTMLREIEELPPGHLLIFQNDAVHTHAYWKWPFASLHRQAEGSFEAAKQEFVERLQRAVDLCLRADVEVGAYLSGGIDSSSLVALSAKSTRSTLNTFSVAFTEDSYDERVFQKLVADRFQTRHHMVECDLGTIEQHFKDVIWHTETPLFRTAPTPLYYLSTFVQNNGIKVVLTGEGADEVLFGYDLFRELKVRKFWAKRPDSEIRPQLLKRLYGYLPQFKDPRYANIAIRSFKTELLSTSPFYSHLIRWTNNAANKIFFSKALKEELATHNAYDELRRVLPEEFDRVDDLDRAQYLEVITLLRGYLLASQGDRMSMAHGVEGRYPFLDHELIEYSATLPRHFKLPGLKDKYILREAMRPFLPKEICSRPKVAYQAPEIRPFIAADKKTVSPLVEKYLSADAIEAVGLFDKELVGSLIKRVQSSDLLRLGIRDNSAFVQILSTQIFCDRFVGDDLRRLAEGKLTENVVPFRVRLNHQ